MVDDSALLHEAPYDPAKAREYYLRTRKLKGRKKGSSDESSGDKKVKKPVPKNASERRKAADAEVAALKSRLIELQGRLAKLVSNAKAKSNSKADGQGAATKTEKAKATASRNSDTKSRKPLTAKQKKEQAARSKANYEKNKKTAPAQEIAKIRAQIKEIRAKLKAAIAEARQNASKGASNG